MVFRRIVRQLHLAFLVSRNLTLPKELIQSDNWKNNAHYVSTYATTRIELYVNEFFRRTVSLKENPFMCVNSISIGMGCMITGDSGVVKVETALNSFKRSL